MNFGLPNLTHIAQFLAASVAVVGGGYTAGMKIGFFEKPVLEWAPEHFEVSDGYIADGFKVVVARKKLRDDCEVTGFRVELRDSEYLVHPLTPSVAKFSGPASDTVDMFGYRVYVPEMHEHKISTGTATLLGQIRYACPEGDKIVTYPAHENLNFEILGHSNAE